MLLFHKNKWINLIIAIALYAIERVTVPAGDIQQAYVTAVVAIVLAVIAIIAAFVLRPGPPEPQPPAELEDFNVPIASKSDPIPVVFGTCILKSPNVVWYGDLKVEKIKDKQGK